MLIWEHESLNLNEPAAVPPLAEMACGPIRTKSMLTRRSCRSCSQGTTTSPVCELATLPITCGRDRARRTSWIAKVFEMAVRSRSGEDKAGEGQESKKASPEESLHQFDHCLTISTSAI